MRNIQRSVEQLEQIGFLKVFRAEQGVRGNYGALINKFEPTIGKHKGKRLCAEASADYDNPVYRDADETPSERPEDADESLSRRTGVGDESPIQEEECKKENEIERTRSNAIVAGQEMPIKSNHLQQLREDTEADLTRYLHDCIKTNPSANAVPANWKTLWRSDIAELLNKYSATDLRDIISGSQTPRWQKYVVRGEGLKKMADPILAELRRDVEARMSITEYTPTNSVPRASNVEFLDGEVLADKGMNADDTSPAVVPKQVPARAPAQPREVPTKRKKSIWDDAISGTEAEVAALMAIDEGGKL